MKKRSLFVATAMLLVAVLVATGATYAWFQSVGSANTTISMKVANGDSIEISADASSWKSSLANSDFTALTADSIWTDLSTIDGENFYADHYANEDDPDAPASIIPDKFVDGNAVEITVYVRASKAGTIQLTNGLNAGNNTNLLKALRMSVKDEAAQKATIIAAQGTAYDAVKGAVANDASAYETITPATVGTMDLHTLSDADIEADHYYHTSVTFCFWVEGTVCSNAMIVDAASEAVASMTFALAE